MIVGVHYNKRETEDGMEEGEIKSMKKQRGKIGGAT